MLHIPVGLSIEANHRDLIPQHSTAASRASFVPCFSPFYTLKVFEWDLNHSVPTLDIVSVFPLVAVLLLHHYLLWFVSALVDTIQEPTDRTVDL
jgi:hypothetical protein